MLGKLIKYEFKACGRVFFPIYIGILVLAAANGLFNNYNIFQFENGGFSFSIGSIQNILILVLFALFVALFVLTIVLTIQRFKKNLLEDEGYLMFTLPVSSKNLILSKYLVALIFIVLSTIVAVLSFIFIGLLSGNVSFSDIMSIIRLEIFERLFEMQDLWKFALMMVVIFMILYSTFILTVYLSISVGQLPQFNKFRVVAGVIAFFLINMIISYIQNFINRFMENSYVYDDIMNGMTFTFTTYDMIGFVLNILIIVTNKLLIFLSKSYFKLFNKIILFFSRNISLISLSIISIPLFSR